MVVRRTVANDAPPAKDKSPTKVVIPEDTDAEITEKIGAKTVQYKAKVVTDQSDDDNEFEETFDDFEMENSFPFRAEVERGFASVPKDQIDVVFDYLLNELSDERYFYAKVTRQPDGFSDRFALPCNTEMSLGVFQFTPSDRFSFIPNLQQLARSGGRFNILVFRSDQTPIEITSGWTRERGRDIPTRSQLGMRNLLVPDPPPREETQRANDPSQNLITFLDRFAEQQQRNTEMLLKAIENTNRPREQSSIERAIENKIVSDLLADKPPPPSNNKIEDAMANMLMLPAFADRMARRMFPDNPTPEEKSTLDKLLENDVLLSKGLDVVQGFGSMLAQIAAMRMQQAPAAPQMQPPEMSNPIQQPNPNPLPAQTSDAVNEFNLKQMELVNEILIELETDNAINADNVKLKELSERYPDIFPLVQMACKTQSFDDLINTLSSVVDFDQHGLLDEEGDFNERGLAIKARLKEFFIYMKG